MSKLINIGFHTTIFLLSLVAAIFSAAPIDSLLDTKYIGSQLTETTGKIISSELRSNGRGRGAASYSVDIQYEYILGDQKLTGYRLQHLHTSFSKDEADEFIRQFYPGKNVPVFYAVKRPSYSVLLENNSLIEYFAIFVMALFLSIFFYLFLLITLGRIFNFFMNRFIHD